MREESPALAVTDDFQVTWRDPADAGFSWLLDDAHYDQPMPALTQEAFAAIMAYVGRRTVFLHGYAFACNSGPTMPNEALKGKDVFKVWHDEYFPRVKQGCETLRSRELDYAAEQDVVASLEALFDEVAELHFLTMSVVQPFLSPTMALLEFCEASLGEDAGNLVASVLQNLSNDTSASAMALSDLALFAGERPELAAAVRALDLDAVAATPGGREFLDRFEAFLETYGWRAERWSALHIPTWAEAPAVPLRLIARFMEAPEHTPGAALSRSPDYAQEATREIESRLGTDAQAEFQALVQAAAGHVPMSEQRTFCQLLIWGSLRQPLLRLGRRLEEQGLLASANDVFYLSSEEIGQALEGGLDDSRALVERRKQDLRAAQARTPPLHVGLPASARTLGPAQKLFVRHFRGPDERLLQEGRTLKGLAASRGGHRGRARVIRDLAEADRLEPGDVLVTGTTSAPWTPLFAIAGAIVTDAGGILAHSAICAREYGIPCVVGTSVGTRLIPDGAYVTVDGTDGRVEIEIASS